MFAALNSFLAGGASPVGQQAYTSAGSFYWTAPYGVTSVCVVCVGGGGGANSGAAGGGGELRYKNNIPVTPGTSYLVNVGNGGNYSNGGASKFDSTTVIANGGSGATSGSSGGAGGSGGTGDGGGNGGDGAPAGNSYGSGGGAGGYSGNGGAGGNNNNHTAGTGGAGGGGASYITFVAEPTTDYLVGFGGGGVGILGEGTSQPKVDTISNVNGGSGGQKGGGYPNTAYGGAYGGGGGAASGQALSNGIGGIGAVRIIWGAGRAFPSTNTGDL